MKLEWIKLMVALIMFYIACGDAIRAREPMATLGIAIILAAFVVGGGGRWLVRSLELEKLGKAISSARLAEKGSAETLSTPGK